MKLNRRRFLAATAATLTMPATIDFASAEEKVIRFAMPQDFTRVYTFVTAEYSQGQRDYITLGQPSKLMNRILCRRHAVN